mmetsp:Transcript_50020/g.139578  ORF Transcript_50020/g.139578 Transcript_50020/m.139578 type:complete len:127 (-) Transcript_50020:180-560(-)
MGRRRRTGARVPAPPPDGAAEGAGIGDRGHGMEDNCLMELPSGAVEASPQSFHGGGSSRSLPPSCLKSPKTPPRRRTDTHGTLIERGKRGHKVIFIDEAKTGSSLVEVKEVVSYKNSSGGCQCVIS